MRKRGQSSVDGSSSESSLTSHKVEGLVNGEANGYTVHGVTKVSAVKPVLSSLSKKDKTKALKPFGILMQVTSTSECSKGLFCNTFDLH